MKPNREKLHLISSINISICTIILILFVFQGGLYGQQDFRGTIEGQIKDATGGAIPGVTVTIRLLSQNSDHTTLTNDNGFYTFSYLDPGTYQLKAEMPGFKTYERTQIELQVNDKLKIDITLAVGEVSEEVIVRGDTTPLVQQVPNFDQTVDEKQVEDLPLNGRNSYQLFGLTAGVLPEGDPRSIRPFDNEATSDFTVGGTGNRNNQISLDGGTNITGSGRVVFIPSTEAIKEFKVTTSAFDASVGNTAGSIINASIKAGGKKFRGSLYEYHRNSVLDANFWHGNRQNTPLPSARWNQFGGTLGGPLNIPFVKHEKDRSFFFFNYEGMRQNRIDDPLIRTVPTERERNGDFSQTFYLNREGQPRQVTIYDPMTTRCIRNCDRPPDPRNPNRRLAPVFRREPFKNNVIPQTRINSVARNLLQFIPLPNRPGDPMTGRNNFISSGIERDIYDQVIGRIDHKFSDRQNFFVSFSYSNRDHWMPNWFNNIGSPNLGIQNRASRRVVVDDTYTFENGLVVNTQYALARYLDENRQGSIGVELAAVGFTPEFISQVKNSFNGQMAFPDLNIENYLRLGTNGDNVKSNVANDAHELRVNFTKMKGKHGLHWGFDGILIRRNEFNLGLPNGRLSFNKNYTHGPDPNQSQSVAAGSEFATFLLGFPTGGYIEEKDTFAIQDLYAGAFIQDDWKVSRRLTLNAGVRWEYWLPRTERFDRMTRGFDFVTENPIADDVRENIQAILDDPDARLSGEIRDVLSNLNLNGGLLFAGKNGVPRGQLNSRPFLFAPRLGFAWQVTEKTVLRGGAGLYFEPLTRLGAPHQDGFNARTGLLGAQTDDETGPRPSVSLDDPFPGDLVLRTGSDLGFLTRLGQDVNFYNPDRSVPSVLRTEIGIQREIPGRIGINANYLMTRWRGRSVDLELNEVPDSYIGRGTSFLNQAVPNPFYGVLPAYSNLGRNPTIQLNRLLRPYPLFNSLKTNYNIGRAWYHGFNLNVSRRFNRGLSFQVAYTNSKGMTATSYANVSDRINNRLDKRLLDDDRPQRLVINSIYELPFGRGKRFLSEYGSLSKLLEGWQVSAISTMMSGRPIHFATADRDRVVATGLPYALPEGPHLDPAIDRWVWFNRDAFRVRHQDELKNVPQNLPNVRMHGINTVDLRLTRNFQMNERVRMQFIAETFNLANRVQFKAPNMDIRNQNFGTTAEQANLPRSIQFALKLQF